MSNRLLNVRTAGTLAFMAGQPLSANPHPITTEEHGAWARGWGTAQFGSTFTESTSQGTHCGKKLIIVEAG